MHVLYILIGEQVAAQTRAIMSGTFPSSSYNTTLWNPIPRRPKRKGKLELANSKFKGGAKKGKGKVDTFQRKLVVFRYMGSNAPAKFTRKDSRVLTRGMLPEIPLNATEMEVREEICSVIKNSCEVELSTCQPFNFEFMDMCGKNASVPNLKPGTTFNCKTVKKLAGSGAVYIRMTKDFEGIGSSEDSDVLEMPQSDAQPGTSYQQGTSHSSLLEANESPTGSSATQSSFCSVSESTGNTSFSTPLPSTSDASPLVLSCNETFRSDPTTSTVHMLASLDCSVVTDQMVEVFPQFSKEQLKFLLECCERDPDKVADVLEDPLSSATLQRILRSFKIKKTVSESPRLRVECDEEEDEWVESAIAFYKTPRVLKDGEIRIFVAGQPGVDTGKKNASAVVSCRTQQIMHE